MAEFARLPNESCPPTQREDGQRHQNRSSHYPADVHEHPDHMHRHAEINRHPNQHRYGYDYADPPSGSVCRPCFAPFQERKSHGCDDEEQRIETPTKDVCHHRRIHKRGTDQKQQRQPRPAQENAPNRPPEFAHRHARGCLLRGRSIRATARRPVGIHPAVAHASFVAGQHLDLRPKRRPTASPSVFSVTKRSASPACPSQTARPRLATGSEYRANRNFLQRRSPIMIRLVRATERRRQNYSRSGRVGVIEGLDHNPHT
jgi:hypothetical protein